MQYLEYGVTVITTTAIDYYYWTRKLIQIYRPTERITLSRSSTEARIYSCRLCPCALCSS